MTAIIDFLKRVDLFTGLSDEMLAQVADMCRPQTYSADSTIIQHNTPSDKFYLIEEGSVKIKTAPSGKTDILSEAAVITLGRGQSFGEMGLVDHGTRSATVRAATDARLLAIDCQQFTDLCEANSDVGYQIMKNIAIDLSFKLRYRNMI